MGAHSSVTQDVTEQHFGIHRPAVGPALDRVVFKVAELYGLAPERLRGRSRRQPLARIRQLGYFVAREATAATTTQIARAFCRADHTTVLYGLRVAEDMIAGDADTKAIVNQLIVDLRG